MDTGDIVIGERGDPTVFYGPSVARSVNLSPKKESEQDLTTDGPLAGAVTAGEISSPLGGVTPQKFIKSPVGWLLILLAGSYVAFHKVFGA